MTVSEIRKKTGLAKVTIRAHANKVLPGCFIPGQKKDFTEEELEVLYASLPLPLTTTRGFNTGKYKKRYLSNEKIDEFRRMATGLKKIDPRREEVYTAVYAEIERIGIASSWELTKIFGKRAIDDILTIFDSYELFLYREAKGIYKPENGIIQKWRDENKGMLGGGITAKTQGYSVEVMR